MVRRSCVFGLLAAVLCAAALIAAGRAQASAPTVVSLGFDDGYTSQYGVRSMLASHGMHGTFFIISGFVGTGEFMSWSQVAALAADGNEIGGHTVDHLDLTTVSAAEAQHQICDDRTALLAHGLQVTSFAYPYGASDEQVEQIAEDCGYESARTTGWFGPDCPSPCTESIPPRDPFATSVVGFSDQTNAELQTVVTNAEASGGWAQIVIHGVCDSGCAITATRLNAFLDWLAGRVAAGAVVVKTVHEVMSMPPPPPDTSITDGPSGLTSDPSPSFSFTSDASSGVTFACRLDGPGAATGSWGACTSPKAYASRADGSYTFRVRASNTGGTDQTPATQQLHHRHGSAGSTGDQLACRRQLERVGDGGPGRLGGGRQHRRGVRRCHERGRRDGRRRGLVVDDADRRLRWRARLHGGGIRRRREHVGCVRAADREGRHGGARGAGDQLTRRRQLERDRDGGAVRDG